MAGAEEDPEDPDQTGEVADAGDIPGFGLEVPDTMMKTTRESLFTFLFRSRAKTRPSPSVDICRL